MEHLFSKGRSIKVEQIDGVTRQSFGVQPNANEYVTDKILQGKADVLSCMRDSRYKTDPHFREFVFNLMKQAEGQGTALNLSSGQEMGVLERAMAAENGNSDNILEQKESIKALFGTELYRNSAAERRRVMEIVRNSDPRFMQEMPSYRYEAPANIPGQFKPGSPEAEAAANQ